MSDVLIRPHRRDDADRIAEILAAGWRQAYSHFMPRSFLAPRIDPAYRRAEVAEWLDDEFEPDNEAVFVAEEAGAVRGFIHMILGDKGDVGATGHVSLLYVDPAQQRRGTGRALLAAGARWLAATSPGPLALSAFADNTHRFAYDAMGGIDVKHLLPLIDGMAVETVIYLWPDPTILFGR
jgi:GNAT superfamily N-acetyltransferase